MKTKLLKVLFGLVNFAAIFAVATTSLYGHYEPECPKKLQKYQKKQSSYVKIDVLGRDQNEISDN